MLNIGLERARERRFARDLIALVLIGTGLSAWLGWAWAGRAIEPVRRLAAKVEVLEPSQKPADRFAPDFAADEVGALAQAFDRYQEKLYEYIRRERAFTADASHELRTPLAVIRGALEVMLDSGCDAATETRLKRMQRGSDELRDLLDALLLLARSDERDLAATGASDVGQIVAQLLRERRDGFNERHLDRRTLRRIASHGGRAGARAADRDRQPAARRHAVRRRRNASRRHRRTTRPHRTSQRTAAPLTAMPSDPRIGTEKVLGLSMIRRVCERWAWHLDEQTADNGDRTFELRFAVR